ncbi:daunorubicin resistance protein DrrA family ABC transporter ATP-binding protein [Nocardia higoensis]|uniref:daunorubicin resistance protein DrrA family ABC transporter ATP-binding protein n=1 Tax=Nocardia higoensis TaxID=228599 RepID=UPI000306A5A3|nr:daunorubicin resistance protein DrrA family ABC transporter ATP-binding protein [Nocardia higoensis]
MTTRPTSALTVRRLRKSYGEHRVLTGLDLEVPAGSIFSLLGPNGAGKTTLVRILATLTTPDSGEVRVFGHDLIREAATVRGLIGVTGQFAAVDKVLTGAENLQLAGRLLHLPGELIRARRDELLERFDLVAAAGKPADSYSGGMRRRLDLAMSLMGRPRLVFLDEPTTGLDPRSRRELWAVIRELAAEGVTILLTTQYLEEADQLADRIAVLDGGRIVAEGTAGELKQRVPGGHIALFFADAHTLDAAARTLAGLDHHADHEQLSVRIPSDGNAADIKHVLDRLADHDVTIERLAVHSPDLDDVFFALTGHPTPTGTAA